MVKEKALNLKDKLGSLLGKWLKKPTVKCPYCGTESKWFKSRFDMFWFIVLVFFGFWAPVLFLVALLYAIYMSGKVACPHCRTALN